MIADDRIEGNLGGGDGFFIRLKHPVLVPGHIAQGDAGGGMLGAVLAGHAPEVSQRPAAEALEVFLGLHLRVGHREQGVVGAFPEGLQFKVKRLLPYRNIVLGSTGREVGHIARGGNHKDKAGVLMGVQGKAAVGRRLGKAVTVGHYNAGKGASRPLHRSFYSLGLQRQQRNCRQSQA